MAQTNSGTLKKYEHAVIAVDVVIFTIKENQLQALLIQLKKAPYQGFWAAPGGLVKADESLEQAAIRQLVSKTGLSDVYLEQLYTFGEVERDPYGRVVTVAYTALISAEKEAKLKTTEEYSGVKWTAINKLPKLAYDHRQMISLALERLKGKLGYTNIVYGLLPKEFTLSELQKVYEIILGRKLDKRNFRKKIESLKLLKKTGKKRSIGPSRPAELYNFKARQPQTVNILNI